MSHATRTFRRFVAVALAVACTSLVASAMASAAGKSARHALSSVDSAVAAGKLDQQVVDTLRAAGSVDAIVTFDYRSIVRGSLNAPHGSGGPRRALQAQRTAFTAQEQSAIDSAGAGASVVRPFANLPVSFVKFDSESALLDVVNDEHVTGIRVNHTGTASLAESLPLIHQPEAAAAGKTGAGTYVAVLDTGVDYTRSAFGCTAPGQPAACKVSLMYDENDGDGYIDDGSMHGTNVAGIVAGVAPGTHIIAMDVYGWSGGKQQWSESAVTAAINQVINLKANGWNIVAFNFSGGQDGQYNDGTCPNAGLASVFNTARQWGILPVVSAGNGATVAGAFKRGIGYPACVPGAVSVGAVADSAHGVGTACDAAAAADQIMYFSQAGSTLSMLAPGNCITAAGITMQGTSQAAPHAAGAAAVLAQAKFGSSLYYLSGMQDVQSALTSSGPSIYDSRVGLYFHRLDVMAAVRAISPVDSTPPVMGAVTEQFTAGTLNSTVPVQIKWSATDASGVTAYDVYSSSDGAASWTQAQLGTTATALVFQLTPGVKYQFSVRAKDGAGNWSNYRMSEFLTPTVFDDSSFTSPLTPPWSKYTWSEAYQGTSYTASSNANSGINYKFTGRDAAMVAPTFATAGSVNVWCDGASWGTVDLSSSTMLARQVVAQCHFAQRAEHTMRIEVAGTGRIDLDAFLNLS